MTVTQSLTLLFITGLSTYCQLQEINYDSPRGGVSVITEKGELTTSYLLVQRARVSDSGKYTCAPSNANPSTVSVHILSGTYLFLAPCQDSTALVTMSPDLSSKINSLLVLFPSILMGLLLVCVRVISQVNIRQRCSTPGS